MDAIGTAFSVLKGLIDAVHMAKESGWLGGSTGWMTYAQDLASITGNFSAFITEAMANPGAFDNLTDEEIRARLAPEGWTEKETRIKAELGL
jgi:hypothetical protein